MKKKIELSVNKACQEKWESFDKNKNGGFCERCKKNVIDFTNKTDTDIFHFLNRMPINECGRFKSTQLRTYYDIEEKRSLNKAVLITAGLLSLTQTNEVSAQNAKNYTLTEQTTKDRHLKNDSVSNDTLIQNFKIKGHIIFDDLSDAVGANILIKGTINGTTSNENGIFELIISAKENDKKVLIVSFPGIQTIEKEIVTNGKVIDMGTINLVADIFIMGEICYVNKWSPRGIFQRIIKPFRRK